ncbi:MAG TPA: hypothetical protein VMT62_06455 [Syntrophorhabdaceae bacterium]|nr:hypothetical protein [Syntrophorhabdaceae bacterium]
MESDAKKEIVRILMESRSYFELNPRERLNLVVHVLEMLENDQTPNDITE